MFNKNKLLETHFKKNHQWFLTQFTSFRAIMESQYYRTFITTKRYTTI